MKAGKVMNLLQISRSTLKRYREKGILKARRLPSGQYTFDDDSVFLLKNGRSPRLTLLYGRVSTYKQKHDLANQMQELQDFAEKKGYQVCEDIINVSKTRRKRVLPAMQSKLISAVEFKQDRHLTDVILDTIESNLVDELNTPENHENLKRLRSYLHRRWVDIKPFKMRHLSVIKAIGCCESQSP